MRSRALPSPPSLAVAAALAAVTLLPGCITRSVRDVTYEDPQLVVSLRKQVRWFETVDRGFDHPATIAPARLVNILAALDVEKREDEATTLREAAVPTEVIFDVGEKLSEAFARADSSQEIVVQAMRKERRFGLFHRKYLTSFTSYLEDDLLYIHLGRVNWKIPKRDEDQGRIPEPSPGEREMDFRVKPGPAMRPVGPQAVAVSWRDPGFATSNRLRVGSGKPVRRTILMEEELPEGEEPLTPAEQIESLTPEVLRALADLEEARRAGRITETEYRAQRYELLSRGLPEAPERPDGESEREPDG